MRWLYCSERNPEEWAFRRDTEARIDAWWREFASRSGELDAAIRGEADWDLPQWMETHLQAIHPDLAWEFGPAAHGDGWGLVITPEAEHGLRPLVDTTLARAPKLPGWEFGAFRLPLDPATAQGAVVARCGGDLGPTTVAVSPGQHGVFDLLFESPQVRGADDAEANSRAFVLTESLLGEEVLDKWVGVIEVRRRRGGFLKLVGRGERATLSLEVLQPTVARAIAERRDALPQTPWYQGVQSGSGAVLKLEPQQARDYPGQDDLLVAHTPSLDLWQATHAPSFHSERFSRFGEIFCYLKIDGTQGLDEEKFAAREDIEDALDEVLMPAGLGCHIGGGTGLMYSYIELALTDHAKGVEAIRQRLRAGNIPRRTWILFHDVYLAGEWVGVYDETPPPPVATTGALA